jgi:hypothetical protein
VPFVVGVLLYNFNLNTATLDEVERGISISVGIFVCETDYETANT